MTLKDCRALVTGANQGFGLAVAHALAAEGANLMLCARTADKLESARSAVQEAHTNVNVFAVPTDVADERQVNALVQYTLEKLGGVDVLVCNAGVYGPKGPIQSVDWNEWVQAININLLGTVLPCRAVLPHMLGRKSGKIIILSGGGATKPMPNISAYAASKAAVVRFAETLAEEVRDSHIDVNSVAPGALNTRMLDEVLAAGPEKVGKAFFEQSVKQKAQGGTPLEQGARLVAFLASAATNGITAKLISAAWDNWKELPEHFADLQKTDVFTLRRIVPKERGMTWN